MMIRHILFMLLFLCGGAFPLHAQRVDVQKAREKLQISNFKLQNSKELRLLAQGDATFTGYPLYYVFGGEDDGFVVVGGDDCMPEVLGYSEHGRWTDSVNDNLRWWLGEYEWQVAEAKRLGVKVVAQTPDYGDVVVKPLVTCQWGQYNPFNLYCPQGFYGDPCAAGCVAVAVAQIMYYHRWPRFGSGKKAYECFIDGDADRYDMLQADFGNVEFQWELMRDHYDEESEAYGMSEMEAAKLLYHVGLAIEMTYGTYSSGTSVECMVDGLRNHLRYDVEVSEGAVWEMADAVLDDLMHGQPVLVAGRSVDWRFNHVFVCDGYRSDGYFHFNWGWYGKDDGWFLLTRLEPNDTREYNHDQTLLHGICPHRDGDEESAVRRTSLNPSEGGEKIQEYFTLSGMRTAMPTRGVVLRCDGQGHVQKIIR